MMLKCSQLFEGPRDALNWNLLNRCTPVQKRRNFPSVVHILIFDKMKTSDCTQYVQKSSVSNGSVVITWTKGWINDEVVLSHCWLGVRKSTRPEKNEWWGVRVWGVVQIVCSWCHCIQKPHHLLPHLNTDWFYHSGTGLPSSSLFATKAAQLYKTTI